MKQVVKILSYIIKGNDKEIDKIREFFTDSKYYVQVKNNENLYRRKYGSRYFEIIKDNNLDFRILTWTVGGFGVILPHKNRILGLVDRSGERMIQKDFTDYLIENNIDYRDSYDTKTGMNQSTLIVISFVIAIVLAILINMIF
ncbi:MAG: hypothetical protein GY756_27840 [bacterium]|nr:hypothetical protein [bacterium]